MEEALREGCSFKDCSGDSVDRNPCLCVLLGALPTSILFKGGISYPNPLSIHKRLSFGDDGSGVSGVLAE